MADETKSGPRSFKVEVIADSSGEFCGNAMRYATREVAEAAAIDLMYRWTLVREWRVVESNEEVNDTGQKPAYRVAL